MTEKLDENKKLDVEELLKDLDKYEPKWRGWHWREKRENIKMGEFTYREMSEPLKRVNLFLQQEVLIISIPSL